MMGKHKAQKNIFQFLFGGLFSQVNIAVEDFAKVIYYLRVPKMRKVILGNVFRFLQILQKRVAKEGILKESASLTYITILSFVPFVSFIVLIAPDLPVLNLGDKFRQIVAHNFIPGSANAIMNFVDGLITKRVGFNIFNFVLMVITSYSLFTVIRGAFDRILSMQQRISYDFITQLVKFFGTILFGMFIILLLFSSSSIPVVTRLLHMPVLKWLMVVVPFVLQFLALTFLYMLLPSVRIKRASLIRGAFWTTVIWVLAKSLFDVYIYNLTNMEAIYGVMAVLPIFLMWIYLNWVIILGGIVLVSIIDSEGKTPLYIEKPEETVRITMEMYADTKLAKRLEGMMDKKSLIDTIFDSTKDENK